MKQAQGDRGPASFNRISSSAYAEFLINGKSKRHTEITNKDSTARRRCDSAERRTVDVTGRIAEVGTIQDVDCVDPDFYGSRFPHCKPLHQVDIQADRGRAVQVITSQSS